VQAPNGLTLERLALELKKWGGSDQHAKEVGGQEEGCSASHHEPPLRSGGQGRTVGGTRRDSGAASLAERGKASGSSVRMKRDAVPSRRVLPAVEGEEGTEAGRCTAKKKQNKRRLRRGEGIREPAGKKDTKGVSGEARNVTVPREVEAQPHQGAEVLPYKRCGREDHLGSRKTCALLGKTGTGNGETSKETMWR